MIEEGYELRDSSSGRAPLLQMVEELGKSAAMLEKQIAILAERLEPVLGEDRPSPNVEGKLSAVRPGSSSLALTLAEMMDRLDAYARRIERLNYRLEV